MSLLERGIWYSFQPCAGGVVTGGERDVGMGMLVVVWGGLVWQSGTDRHNLDQRWNLRALQSDRKHWLNSCPI